MSPWGTVPTPRPPHQDACASVETPMAPATCAAQPSPVCTSQWSWRAGKEKNRLSAPPAADTRPVRVDHRGRLPPRSVRAAMAGARAQPRDRLVTPAEDRVLALEDLHQHPRVVALELERRL